MRGILLVTFLLVVTGIARAQSADGAGEDNTFEYDPFFSDSFNEWLTVSAGDDTAAYTKRDVRRSTLLLRMNDRGLDYENVFEAGPYNSNPLYSLFPSLPMIHFNRVNALFIGLKEERMQWHPHNEWFNIPNIHPHGFLGYATGQREWQYALGLEKLLGKENHVLIGGEYHKATTTTDEWRVGLNETSVTAITAGYDYLDYYRQQGWGAYLMVRTDRLFEGGVAFNNERYTSLDLATRWSLFGSRASYRRNPSISLFPEEPVDLSALTVSASFNPKQLLISRALSLSAMVEAELADPGLASSDFDFSKYTAEIVTRINFERGGVFKYRLRSSAINGNAPLFKQLYLGGVGTLRALPFKSLSGNQMLLSNAEIQFGAPLGDSNDWIDFNDFHISLFLDSGWTDFEEELLDKRNPLGGISNFDFADLRHNGGFGAGSNLLRAEVAWDLRNSQRAPVFWLRFNPTF